MRITECAELEAHAAKNPGPETWLRFWLAVFGLGAGALREAGILREGVAALQVPEDPYALVAAGRYAESLGDWSGAITAFGRAQALRKRNPAIALCRAHALARLGRFDDADRLFASVGAAYAWPARITRMGTAFWNELSRNPPALPDESGWRWIVKPRSRLGTVVLVSMDGNYANRYAPPLLANWKSLRAQSSDTSSARTLHLHMHLINAEQALCSQLATLAVEAGCCSVALETLPLPALQQIATNGSTAEHRTWFACARLRVLPWWLERASDGVLVTDVDIEWLATPSSLWHDLGDASAASVRFDPRKRALWEEWYLTLALFRADERGRAMARDLGRYVSHFLNQGDGLWSLDQAALWSVFARHGGPVGLQPGFGAVAGLSPALVQLPGQPVQPSGLISTSVASLRV